MSKNHLLNTLTDTELIRFKPKADYCIRVPEINITETYEHSYSLQMRRLIEKQYRDLSGTARDNHLDLNTRVFISFLSIFVSSAVRLRAFKASSFKRLGNWFKGFKLLFS